MSTARRRAVDRGGWAVYDAGRVGPRPRTVTRTRTIQQRASRRDARRDITAGWRPGWWHACTTSARRRRAVSPSDDRADRHGVGLKCREARGATRGSRPVASTVTPSSIDCASTGRTHSLHPPHVRDFDKSEWRADSSGTADRGRSIPNRAARAVLTAHGQESGSMSNLTAQGLTVDNRPEQTV